MAYGTINNTVVNQILDNQPYDDYVAYKTDAYNYYVIMGDIDYSNNTYHCYECTVYHYYSGSYNQDASYNVDYNRSLAINAEQWVYSSFDNGSLKLRGVYNETNNFLLYLIFFGFISIWLFEKCLWRRQLFYAYW